MDAPMTAATTTGQFDFDDGGTYRGGSDAGRAHGYGVCTGPAGQGEYAGAWREGFETSGVYQWPPSVTGGSGAEYSGQWMQGKRHGLGVERRGRWIYRGEWTQGAMGRYGVRQCTTEGSIAKYEGTWTGGLQDGYGLETYSDAGTYQGQWMKGARHGYGVRKSAMYSSAAQCRPNSGTGSQSPASAGHHLRSSSLTSVRSELLPETGGTSAQQISASTGTNKGRPASSPHQHHHHNQQTEHYYPVVCRMGFFLTGRCMELDSAELGRRGSFLARQLPASLRSSFSGGKSSAFGSTDRTRRGSAGEVGIDVGDLESSRAGSRHRHHHHHQQQQQQQFLAGTQRVVDTVPTEGTAVELYSGEWKNDRRSGFGVCERSDGLKYEGEWLDDCKNGYGITTFNGGPDNPGGWREEGKYRNNVLVTSGKRLLGILPPVVRSSKQRERIDAAVAAALRAAQIAGQKSDIANSRMESARSKAELADQAAAKAKADADRAKMIAREVEQKERLTADTRHTSAVARDIQRRGADQYQRSSSRPASAVDGMPSENSFNAQQQNPSTSRILQQQQQQQQNNRQLPYNRSSAYTQHRSSMEQMNADRRNYGNEDGGSHAMDDGYVSTGDMIEVGDRLIFRDNSLHGQRMRGGRDVVDGTGHRMHNYHPHHHQQQQHVTQDDYDPGRYSLSNSRRVSPAPSTSSLQQQQQHRSRHDYSMMNHVDATAATSGLRFRSPVESEIYVDESMDNMASQPQLDGFHHDQTNNISSADQPPGTVNGDIGGKGLVASRPSLRYRRDFRCPNLVIFNKNSSVTNLTKPSAGTNLQQRAVGGSYVEGSQNNSTAAIGMATSGTNGTTTLSTAVPVSVVRLPKRRLTLPGIVKYTKAPDGPGRSRSSSASSTGRTPSISAIPEKAVETEFNDGLSVRGGRPVTEMYIVENGTRKLLEEFEIQVPVAADTVRRELPRVISTNLNGTGTGSRSSLTATVSGTQVFQSAGKNSLSNTLPTLPRERSVLAVASPDGLDPPKPITKRYKVAESVTEPGTSRRWAGGRRDLLGSLPDLSAIQRIQQPTPIPRNEAQMLSQQKREEIQMLIEMEQERRRRALVLRFGDFKEWVWTRQLTLALIALNVALATAFFRLLSG